MLLCFALVMALGAASTATASATSTDATTQATRPPVRLEPSPATASLPASPSQDAPPKISSIRRNPTPPNRLVTVRGSTGSCNQQGTLTVAELPAVSVPVSGERNGTFLARLTIPGGTLPGAYKLKLSVACGYDSQLATAELTVDNHAPVAVDDSAATIQDTPVTIAVTANDTDPDDPDGYPTIVRLAGRRPTRGTVEVQPDQRILYTPRQGTVGEDHFQYSYCDDLSTINAAGQINAARQADSACGTATVIVTVRSLPSVEPTSTPPDRQVTVGGSTGSCSQQGTLTVPGMGTPEISVPVTSDQNSNFKVAFMVPGGTPPGGYKLLLTVGCYDNQEQATAELTVDNRAPTAVDDTASTIQDTPVAIAVTVNDTDPDDPDGYPTSVELASRPARGTAEVQPDQRILYTPRKRIVGEDHFQYSYCDIVDADGRKDCGTATVTVTVLGRLPKLSSVKPATTPPNRQVTVDGNTGSCSQQGTLAVPGMGTPEISMPVTGDRNGNFLAVITVPKASFPRPYKLVLSVICGSDTQQGTAGLKVRNRAPTAVDDTATTIQDTPVTIAVTVNDTDPDGDDGYPTLLLEHSPPAHGTTQVPKPDGGSIVYTPGKGFVGEDQFEYSYCDVIADGRKDCGTATVTVTVVGRLPKISSVEPASTPPNRPVTVDGNTGSCSQQGTLTVAELPGVSVPVTGDHNGNFVAILTVSKAALPRAYQLVLTVDCHGNPQQATAALTVQNRAPVAVDDSAITMQHTPVAIAVTANDTDPDGDDGYPTIVFEQRRPAHGTTETRPDGTIVYTPDQGFVGRDDFHYNDCDGTYTAGQNLDVWMRSACGTATVTVTVNPGATTSGSPPSGSPPSGSPPSGSPPSGSPPSGPPPSGPPVTLRPTCMPAAGDVRSLRVAPIKGLGGAELRITAKADRKLATCPLRLLLGGYPSGRDVTVPQDGTISARLPIPTDAKPGISTVRLAATGGQILAETPFEILASVAKRWWQRDLFRLLAAGGVFMVGMLGRAAIRRLRRTRDERSERQRRPIPQQVRAEPHARPVQVTLNRDTHGPPSCTIRLRPQHDVGTQTLKEVPG
jgi:hypothetical protein